MNDKLSRRQLLQSGAAVAALAFSPALRLAARADQAAPDVLSTLRADHPRLLATSADFEILKQKVASDPVCAAMYQKLQADADAIIPQTPSQYEILGAQYLLTTARRVMNRVNTLALVYRLGGDRKYADRAWLELSTAAAYPDWNPSHFLDTAELTHAFAIGYDWLYDVWTPDQRTTLSNAIVSHGLQPGLDSYAGKWWWPKVEMNWNQVCNGGIGLGALAIAEVVPDMSRQILRDMLVSLPLPMKKFAPDGGWPEGPGYWQYATFYNVLIIAGLNSALGSDFGLSNAPGFDVTGDFPILTTGPTGRNFNFADAGEKEGNSPQLFWFASRFHQPGYAAYEEIAAQARPQPWDLLWGAAWKNPKMDTLPRDKWFHNVDVVTMRSGWDPQALFIGFKGGDNKANHSHLDLGSFVLDARGQRWALDLGADDYGLPGYFGKQRWTYYRLRAEGHNTLVIDPDAGPDQDPKAAAPITRFESKPDRAFAIADLSAAYAKNASKVERGIALWERNRAVVQDEIALLAPSEIWWFLHTRADIALSADGATATLSLHGEQLQASILSPQGAAFTVTDPKPLPSSPQPTGQNANAGVRVLAIHLTGVSAARITVALTPLEPGQPAPAAPVVPALAEWTA